MTQALFVRHGPTEENLEKRVQGQRPGRLRLADTEHYIAAVVPLLRAQKPDVIISSDLERAVRTRRILKRFLQIPDAQEKMLPLLRERAMGYYEGMLWDEVPAAFREEMSRDEYDFRKFGGENNEDVRERVRATLQLLARQYAGRRIVAVTHSGWLHELVHVAHMAQVASDGWTKRQAIYEVAIGSSGSLEHFEIIHLRAGVIPGTIRAI